MASEVMDRCPTGIVGFDRMCQGGFIRNSDNLIVGGPGSGKSTFLLQFLWNGATMFNENGLYCSFEPDIVGTLNDSMAYGWDFTKLSNEGRIKFMKFSPHTSVEELKTELRTMISKHNVRRICFDPISVLALNLNNQGKIRETIFELSSLMKRLKVTTILADESLEGEGMSHGIEGEWTKTDILRFLSDSVTTLYENGISGKGDRAIRIVKMRRTRHERKPQEMAITNKGVNIVYAAQNILPPQVQINIPQKVAPVNIPEKETEELKVPSPEPAKVVPVQEIPKIVTPKIQEEVKQKIISPESEKPMEIPINIPQKENPLPSNNQSNINPKTSESKNTKLEAQVPSVVRHMPSKVSPEVSPKPTSEIPTVDSKTIEQVPQNSQAVFRQKPAP